MAQTSYIDKFLSIGKMPLSLVYVLTGEEDYLRERAYEFILEKMIEVESKDFKPSVFFGDDLDADTLGVNLTSLSLFAEKQLIYLKYAGKMNKNCWEVVKNYSENPSDLTVLVIDSAKIDGRQGYSKILKKNSQWYEFKKLYPEQTLTWLNRYCRNKEINITDNGN